MSYTKTTPFLTLLSSRIQVMENLHVQFKAKEDEQQKILDNSDTLGSDKILADLLTKAYSSQAAYVWDMKCELENLLPLYHREHTIEATLDSTNQNVIEIAANFISRTILSCTHIDQLPATKKMIEGFVMLYGNTTQVSSWVDTLNMAIQNAEIRLTSL